MDASAQAGGSGSAPAAPADRLTPECVTLGVRQGLEPSPRPPVRIFLGTEGSQFRPERVFVWSIEQVRDPSRVYEIYLMKELTGFDRRRWTTGFTNYRFAIPDFAGRAGRAIYNDEDQIYLTDPGELFDLEMGESGFLAISPTESSVMVMDCARMSAVWSIEDARHLPKKQLLRRAVDAGLLGPLAGGWNARDEEPVEGPIHLRHYTTLHTQPWRPFPERFVYQDNPLGHLWHDLERSADRASFQLFSRTRPSARHADMVRRHAECHAAPSELDPDLAAMLAELEGESGASRVARVDPLATEPPPAAEGLVLADGAAELSEDDLPWLLDELFTRAERFVLVSADCPAPSSDRNATPLVAPADRWIAHLEAASSRHPEVHWTLRLGRVGAAGRLARTWHRGGRFLGDRAPRVWVMDGGFAGSAAESLARELGWPWERRSEAAAAEPWPDLLITSGHEAAAAGRRVREQAGGRTRLVHLGAEGGAVPDGFDLVATPASAGFFPHPARFETAAPLVRADADRTAAAAESWRKTFEESPAPRLALLVGAADAASLSEADVARWADAVVDEAGNGSVFALVADRRFASALAGRAHVQVGRPGLDDPPTLAHLALADAFAVGGGSEALLAAACATGRPVTILPPSRPARGPAERLRRAVLGLAVAARSNDRGTVRPQQGLERWCSRLIANGWVRPPRDVTRMHRALIGRGSARMLGEPSPPAAAPLDELRRVASAVRDLLGASA